MAPKELSLRGSVGPQTRPTHHHPLPPHLIIPMTEYTHDAGSFEIVAPKGDGSVDVFELSGYDVSPKAQALKVLPGSAKTLALSLTAPSNARISGWAGRRRQWWAAQGGGAPAAFVNCVASVDAGAELHGARWPLTASLKSSQLCPPPPPPPPPQRPPGLQAVKPGAGRRQGRRRGLAAQCRQRLEGGGLRLWWGACTPMHACPVQRQPF